MNLAQLQQRVHRYVQLDLQPLFSSYQAEQKSDDIDGFVAYLVKARVLDPSLVKDLYADTEVDLPTEGSQALAETLLSRKAGGTLVMGPKKGPSGDTAVSPRTPDEVGTVVGDHAAAGGGDGGAGAVAEAQEARFEPIARLGQGAMGAIDVARDLYLRRKVALKTVLPEMAQHKSLLGRFLSEMQITAQLEHPNIVPVYALEIGGDGTLGYAMKLVAGKDFAELLEEARKLTEEGKPLPPHLVLEQRLEIFLKVCDALEYAHAKGIVHRDLKPSNIMVGKHNEVYLMDWGIARPMGTGGKAIDAGIELIPPDGDVMGLRTRVGSTIGTPTYMSPEQAAGKNHELDGRSDLYTMGLILQEVVSLKQAVGGKTLEEVLTKAREARRDPVEVTGGQALPRELEAIVQKATALDPGQRYASIHDLGEDVRRYLRNEPLTALPDDAVRKATRWISRNRTKSLAIMMSIALLGSVGTIITQRLGAAKIEALHRSELRQSELETESAIAAQVLDRKLARYEAALSQLAGAAQLALSRKDGSATGAHFAEDFGKDGGPPDLAPSKRYGAPVSVGSPAVALPAGAAREAHEGTTRPLASALAPALLEALLDTAGLHSHGLAPDAVRAHVADAGTPAYRARIVLADGATVSFPGSADATAAAPASDPSYALAAGKSGVFWGAPIQRGATSVLPVSTAIYEGGELRGVAVLEISMDRLLEQTSQPQLEYVQSRLLIARDGTIRGEENAEGGRAPVSKGVLDAVAEGKSGSQEYDGEGRRWMATYYSLTALDWSFVAVADMGKMAASQKAIVRSDTRAVASAAAAPPKISGPIAPPAPPPAPPPTASATAEPEASASAAPSASAPPAPSLGPPWPKPPESAAPPPSAPPAASSAPRNPFDKWEEYKKK